MSGEAGAAGVRWFAELGAGAASIENLGSDGAASDGANSLLTTRNSPLLCGSAAEPHACCHSACARSASVKKRSSDNGSSSAAMRQWWAARKRSASSAAMQPVPAAVTA